MDLRIPPPTTQERPLLRAILHQSPSVASSSLKDWNLLHTLDSANELEFSLMRLLVTLPGSTNSASILDDDRLIGLRRYDAFERFRNITSELTILQQILLQVPRAMVVNGSCLGAAICRPSMIRSGLEVLVFPDESDEANDACGPLPNARVITRLAYSHFLANRFEVRCRHRAAAKGTEFHDGVKVRTLCPPDELIWRLGEVALQTNEWSRCYALTASVGILLRMTEDDWRIFGDEVQLSRCPRLVTALFRMLSEEYGVDAPTMVFERLAGLESGRNDWLALRIASGRLGPRRLAAFRLVLAFEPEQRSSHSRNVISFARFFYAKLGGRPSLVVRRVARACRVRYR